MDFNKESKSEKKKNVGLKVVVVVVVVVGGGGGGWGGTVSKTVSQAVKRGKNTKQQCKACGTINISKY